MEIKTKLLMTFKTENDKKVSISLDDPSEDITEEDIKNAMDTILAANIFAPGGYDLVATVDAKIVQTDTTDYDLKI